MDLTQEAIEDVLRQIEVLCDRTGAAIAIKPTTLIIRPEIMQAVAKLHGISESEALELIKQSAIDAYNKIDKE